MKFVLFERSSTQRISVQVKDNEDILLNKEYRKSVNEDWRVGKGILIPEDKLVFLGELLKLKNLDKEAYERALSEQQVLKEETT